MFCHLGNVVHGPGEGTLCIAKAWPGMLRGVWGDEVRYRNRDDQTFPLRTASRRRTSRPSLATTSPAMERDGEYCLQYSQETIAYTRTQIMIVQ